LRLANLKLVLELSDLRTRRADHLGRSAPVTADVLGEIGRAKSSAPDHLPPVHLLRAREDAQQRGLARAVAADEPDPRARTHLHP
jgi:hypothetical protein